MSSLLSISIMITSLAMLVTDNVWDLLMQQAEVWLQENHWDIAVTHAVWKSLDWVDRKHKELLVVILLIMIPHLLFSLLLLLGTFLCRRKFFLPWMVSHMISIIIMVTTFTCWTFMSFFVDLLVAIVFPVVGGLVLGLWIGMWRQVYHMFNLLRETDREMMVIFKMQEEGYKQVTD